jgi:hypothetical protein
MPSRRPGTARRPSPGTAGGGWPPRRRRRARPGTRARTARRPPAGSRGQVQVAGERGLVADGGPAGVAGPLERGQQARVAAGVGPDAGAGRDPRVAELGHVVHRPPAGRPDGEPWLAVGPVPGHEGRRLVVGDHRAPADALEPPVALAEVEAAGEGAELRAVQALVALAVHGGLPAPGQQRRSRRPDQHDADGHAPEQMRPPGRPVAPGAPPEPGPGHAYGIGRTGSRLKPASPPPSRPPGAGGA